MPNQSPGEQLLAGHLQNARALELGLVRTLQAHVAVTPAGEYRRGLERHLRETRDHARTIERRLHEIGGGPSLLDRGASLLKSTVAQAVALSKGPLDLLQARGGGAELLLSNAQSEAASEALEIATYTSIENLASAVGDERTAELARTIRADEERVLAELNALIPRLARDVVRDRIDGKDVYDPGTTGAARDARRAGRGARQLAGETAGRARRSARQLRKVPGVARAEGEVKGAVASERDLPIARYDSLTAAQVNEQLPGLSQIDLGKVHAYERRHQGRKSVLDRIETLRRDEPWPGYDEQTVEEIRRVITSLDDDRRIAAVREYERRHKQRQGVLDATERENSRA
jgi:ferritin-like metal-binding protein YciE